MQGTIDAEQRSKQELLRVKKKYEGDISEMEANVDTANRVSRPRLHGCVFNSFRFHFIAFSNRSTLDCVFKCLRFYDRSHRFRVNRR